MPFDIPNLPFTKRIFVQTFLYMDIRTTLSGTGVAIVTPFTTALTVDYDALGLLINDVIANGVNYIVTLGTTGETPVLTTKEKKLIVQYTQVQIANRVPMVVGIGGNDTASVINDLLTFPLDGAVAVLSASPYYNKPSQQGIITHYKAIAEVSPKPIILYNVPGRTGRNMLADTTLHLATVPNIVGIKEAGNDIQQAITLLKHRPPHFLITSGDDDLVLPEMACGIDGVISVVANAYPKLFSTMVNYCMANQFADAVVINNKLLDVYKLLFAENNPAGVKAFLTAQGKIQNNLRLPNVPLSTELMHLVTQFVQANNME